MVYYFKDNNGGIGIAIIKKDIGNITWISKEEYLFLLAEIEKREEEN